MSVDSRVRQRILRSVDLSLSREVSDEPFDLAPPPAAGRADRERTGRARAHPGLAPFGVRRLVVAGLLRRAGVGPLWTRLCSNGVRAWAADAGVTPFMVLLAGSQC
ncbi:hypothetical protein FXN61_07885 [Lentzea sp. PSKA42]|uniref:Uncharacterized protein n=1 Tax=Lentzea indica TaxID=2604800 RepID=A0ABX1FDF8_9PSEU|nr:hypothetical protein [Lentzea indica]NKE56756.1 hypothetical protein [Lentzea indica]